MELELIYYCSICLSEFNTNNELNDHIKTHTVTAYAVYII